MKREKREKMHKYRKRMFVRRSIEQFCASCVHSILCSGLDPCFQGTMLLKKHLERKVKRSKGILEDLLQLDFCRRVIGEGL